jgi:photosystem II stability/assembly factor-like uncharacterized protein
MKQAVFALLVFILFFPSDGISQNVWEPLNGPWGIPMEAIVVVNDSTVVFSAASGGFYISQDYGNSWNKFNNGLSNEKDYATRITADAQQNIFALINDELYVSEAGKNEWIPTGNRFENNPRIISTPSGYVYIINEFINYGRFYSKDLGKTFVKILEDDIYRYIYTYSFNGNGNNYFASDTGWGSIFKMSDDGLDIKRIHNNNYYDEIFWHPSGNILLPNYSQGFWMMDSLGNNFRAVKFDSTNSSHFSRNILIKPNGNILVITDSGQYESIDGGVHWNKNSIPFYKEYGYAEMLWFSDSSIYLMDSECNKRVLMNSTDSGQKWAERADKFIKNSSIEVLTTVSGDVFCKNGDYRPYQFQRNGTNDWEMLPDFCFYQHILTTKSGYLLLKVWETIYRSSDFGNSWVETKLPPGIDHNYFVEAKNGYYYVFSFYSNVNLVSKDEGMTWEKFSNPKMRVQNLYVHPDGSLLGIAEPGWNYVTISEDSGRTWKVDYLLWEIFAMNILRNGDIYVFAINHFDETPGLYLTSDKFKTAQLINDKFFTRFVIDSFENFYVQSGTDMILVSSDKGRTWKPFIEGLPSDRKIITLNLGKDGFFYVGLENDAIYRSKGLGNNPVSTNELNIKCDLEIQPNPVNKYMTVSILSNSISSGHYKIVDINGIDKINGDFNTKTFSIDCSSLAHGMSFLHVYAPDKLIAIEKFIKTN